VSVDLSWNASKSPVVGYNVYRAIGPKGFFKKINSTLDASTNYIDGTVVSGTTYYYAATAVNAKGEESTYSASVQVAVP
jgi:fibronectin type 3 domain-containing protein